jgi:hypothetical protein
MELEYEPDLLFVFSRHSRRRNRPFIVDDDLPEWASRVAEYGMKELLPEPDAYDADEIPVDI